ncbi:MAG: hypothetical protein H6712_15115 [Myxococcales bacterium]|nr:hypothetical protein [Myxococcales bacterium]MCB9715195.1 hypothetical protein [Myxococcales bacterium]
MSLPSLGSEAPVLVGSDEVAPSESVASLEGLGSGPAVVSLEAAPEPWTGGASPGQPASRTRTNGAAERCIAP